VSHFAVNPDVAFALLDHAVHGREAEARAFARFLRGEKWLEDSRLRRRVHSNARIADGKHDVRPRLNHGVPLRVGFIELDVCRFDGEAPAGRHGVARVHDEV